MFAFLIFLFTVSSLTLPTVDAETENIANIQRDEEANYCLLPPYPEHGWYTVSNYPSATPGKSYPSVKLDISCNIGYLNKNTINSIYCVNGKWSATMSTCVRDSLACGKISPLRQLEGTSSNRVQLPWHAGIYEKWSSSYSQRCSGSLITPNKIISAAHCFYVFNDVLQPTSNYVVAVNKQFRPYNDPRDRNSQKSHVVDIKVPSSYRGREANFENDIAIVVVETPFIFHLFIRPVCLDLDSNLDRTQLTEGNSGKSALWTIDDNNDQASEVLKVVDLRYIKYKDCYENTPTPFQQYLTNDKFCARLSNDTRLGIGDAGGGLAFLDPTTKRYYLRGVLTLGRIFAKDNTILNTFTSITKHSYFIKQNL